MTLKKTRPETDAESQTGRKKPESTKDDVAKLNHETAPRHSA